MIISEVRLNEIRIGNWMLIPEMGSSLKIPVFKAKVQGIGMFGDIEFLHTPQITGVSVPLRQLSGIPTTEEILLQSGFVKFNFSHTEQIYSIDLGIYGRLSIVVLGKSKMIQLAALNTEDNNIPNAFICLFDEIKDGKLCFHKLQNLIYELTGKELEINL